MSFATTPVTSLKGVGPFLAKKLHQLNISTVQDLLFHLPFRYQDRTQITPIAKLIPGNFSVIEGKIESTQIQFGQFKRRRSLICCVSDGVKPIFLRFFYFNAAQQQQFLVSGIKIRCFGEVRVGRFGLEMIHPEYTIFNENTTVMLEQNLTAIYPTTENLSQSVLRKLIAQALQKLATDPTQLPELIPHNVLQNFALISLSEALLYVHRPPVDADKNLLISQTHPYQQRLAFEELMAHQLLMLRFRQTTKKLFARSITTDNNLLNIFLKALPYQLTAAQTRVINEIAQDLKLEQPMMRLIQGDVGSGKTVVAAAASLLVLANNFQVILMAPTELLAEQHYKNFQRWLEPLNITTTILTSSQKNKTELLANIATGEYQFIVGTHAVFQQKVVFKNLALIIVDEQHRFGVDQRLALQKKGIKNNNIYPHQLVMSATPIPRTLTMTAYADLDCSIINELPPGRMPVNTIIISNQRRSEIIQRIKDVSASGQQIYWVCTLIEESEILQCQAAEKTFHELVQILPDVRIGLIHGRLKNIQKDSIMDDFKQHNLDLLVATTVIEVGVDVPNASLMIIENPERLGLAQLHQLRGRVGRGAKQSYCVLLYQAPLSWQSKQRLNVIRQFNDGFKIAEQDLQLRGPGEILGTKQTGMLQFKVSDLTRDKNLLEKSQQVAKELLKKNCTQVDLLIQRWTQTKNLYVTV